MANQKASSPSDPGRENNQLRVLHFVASLGYGGAERLVVDLVTRMAAQGVNIRIVSMTPRIPLAQKLFEHDIGVEILGFEDTIYSVASLIRAAKRFSGLAEQFSPDIIHSHLYMPDLIAWCSASKPVRFVSTLHGVDRWWQDTQRMRSTIKTSLYRYVAILKDVRFIAVSDDVKERAEMMLSRNDGRLRVIRNGIDTTRFCPGISENANRKYVLQVGRFYKEKGHDTSLRAFAILRNTAPDLKLVLIGNGPLESQLRKQVCELKIQDSVLFAGEQDDVVGYLQGAKIFWMPSEREGLPLACVEAMACGLPVIVSAVGGLKELVNESCGRLIKAGDHNGLAERTMEILQDEPLSQEMGSRGRERAKRLFSIDGAVAGYLTAYNDLMTGRW